jgi:hypothetical protein
MSRTQLRRLTWLLLAVGAAFVIVGVLYFVIQARDLPSVLGKLKGADYHRTRRGVAFLILAALAWFGAGLAWRTRKSRSSRYG